MTTITLAEALTERSDCEALLESIISRISQNALVPEGSEPAEDPNELMKRYKEIEDRHETLTVAINIANNSVTLPDGTPLVAALVRRDRLKRRLAILTNIADATTPCFNRNLTSEKKSVMLLNVAELRKEADELVKIHRELDNIIQQVNWKTAINWEPPPGIAI